MRRLLVALVCTLLLSIGLVAPATVGADADAPTLTLTPDRGPCDGNNRAAVARGANFPAGRTILLIHQRVEPFSDQGGEAGRAVVAPDGTFTTDLRLALCGPGEVEGARFSVTAQTVDGRDTGPVLARATFTKSTTAGGTSGAGGAGTSGTTPSLPNTGDGGAAARAQSGVGIPALAVALLALLTAAATLRRRKSV